MIAARLRTYLDEHRTPYRVIAHSPTGSSMQSAEMAHIPGARLAKGVLLEDERGPLLAVLPSDAHLDLRALNARMHRHLGFADEEELATLFPDCDLGAVPPVGPAYGMATVWDTELGKQDIVYLEAGDHETLLELSGRAFHELMVAAERGRFCHHA
jgi:Ala-tRNA(Pro) deacylase